MSSIENETACDRYKFNIDIVKEIISPENLDTIIKNVFTMFGITKSTEASDADLDADLLLRKMKFIYTEMQPITSGQERAMKEIECLEEAH